MNTDLGFTGTRGALTSDQALLLCAMIRYHRGLGFTRFHHGDCVGADEYAAHLARQCGYVIICHPPTNDRLRAFVGYDEVREPLPYMQRNAEIVKEAHAGIGTPNTEYPDPARRSGTWATIDMFARSNKPYLYITPTRLFDGNLPREVTS